MSASTNRETAEKSPAGTTGGRIGLGRGGAAFGGADGAGVEISGGGSARPQDAAEARLTRIAAAAHARVTGDPDIATTVAGHPIAAE
jgi:hypothetical protein